MYRLFWLRSDWGRAIVDNSVVAMTPLTTLEGAKALQDAASKIQGFIIYDGSN